MEATTTCTYTTSYYAGSVDTYPYTSSSICTTEVPPLLNDPALASVVASTTAYLNQAANVVPFFLLLIFVAFITKFFLDRMIGVKGRNSMQNTYMGNNSIEGKKIYHD